MKTYKVYEEFRIRMPVTKTELLQGTLDLLILQTVALGPSHGYAINQRIMQISRDALQVQQGSLYPALHRLEEKRAAGLRVAGNGRRPHGQVLLAHAFGPQAA